MRHKMKDSHKALPDWRLSFFFMRVAVLVNALPREMPDSICGR